jgi:putative FmdB family regulatory protein
VPTYQYACTECGHSFEQFQSFSDDALTQCPECEGRLRKLFNAVGVVFKGSGFYRTDSRAGDRGDSPAPAANGTAGDKPTEKSDKPAGEKSSGEKSPAKESKPTPAAATSSSGSAGD